MTRRKGQFIMALLVTIVMALSVFAAGACIAFADDGDGQSQMTSETQGGPENSDTSGGGYDNKPAVFQHNDQNTNVSGGRTGDNDIPDCEFVDNHANYNNSNSGYFGNNDNDINDGSPGSIFIGYSDPSPVIDEVPDNTLSSVSDNNNRNNNQNNSQDNSILVPDPVNGENHFVAYHDETVRSFFERIYKELLPEYPWLTPNHLQLWNGDTLIDSNSKVSDHFNPDVRLSLVITEVDPSEETDINKEVPDTEKKETITDVTTADQNLSDAGSSISTVGSKKISDTGSTVSTAAGSPQTGDNSSLADLITMLILSASCLVAFMHSRAKGEAGRE